jgi:hypothetical protein
MARPLQSPVTAAFDAAEPWRDAVTTLSFLAADEQQGADRCVARGFHVLPLYSSGGVRGA